MVIREAVASDIAAVVEMGRQQVAALYGRTVPDNPVQLGTTAERLIAGDDSVLFIAERDDQPVGMIGMVVFDHHISGARTAGELTWWLDPVARGDGVALLRAAEQWAAEQGATQIQMMAPNARVGLLYERRGYQLVELTYLKPVTALVGAGQRE